jgi:hypothetical protein
MQFRFGCLFVLISVFIANANAVESPLPAPKITTKKGLAGHVSNDQLKALKVGWFYMWSSAPAADNPPIGIEFVPMMWGWKEGPKHDAAMVDLSEKKKAGTSTTLLGFNEPDVKEQANLTTDLALEKWPKLMETGLRLGSPSGMHPDNAWMIEFMREADKKKLRVDFVTVHWYGGADAAGFLAYLEKIHKLYKRPIWITEFAIADWTAKPGKPAKFTQQQVLKFMERVMPALKRLDYVERYSWFKTKTSSDVMGPSALFNDDGSLTEVGKLYSTF